MPALAHKLKKYIPTVKAFSGIYSLVMATVLLVTGIKYLSTPASLFLALFLFLVIIYFPLQKFGVRFTTPVRILLIINTIFSVLIIFSVVIGVRKIMDSLFVLLFLPFLLYFVLSFLDLAKKTAIYIKTRMSQRDYEVVSISADAEDEVQNETRRRFVRLLMGTGVGAIVFLLTGRQRASAATFGSIPGSGTVALKDSAGVKIDPAIKSPTDGFGVTDTLDLAYPYYYGFTHYNGIDWYILKIDSLGSYTYASVINNTGVTYSDAWTAKGTTLVFGSYSDAFFEP